MAKKYKKKRNDSRVKGFSFGLTSGVITTLGLMVGLHSSTHSSIVVISGILIIAVTDALSDAMGMHMSEEAEGKHSHKEIWESTTITFISKFIFALTFVIPMLLFSLGTAVMVSIAWGLLLITWSSIRMAMQDKKKPYLVVLEHIAITVLVIVITHYVGDLIRTLG